MVEVMPPSTDVGGRRTHRRRVNTAASELHRSFQKQQQRESEIKIGILALDENDDIYVRDPIVYLIT